MDNHVFELILMTDCTPFVPLQVKCWQIRKLSKAPQAAGAIHTDFERGFICAEVTFCY
jgi:ribosome-binding ATPase YchF (GTP1/OBG family)